MEDDSKLNRISFIIALIIIVIIIFIAYSKFVNVEVKPETKLTENEIQKIIQEKYNFLISKRNFATNDLVFFTDKNLDVNSIDDKTALYIAYSLLSKEDKTSTGSYDENCLLSNGIYTKSNYPSSCLKETFDKEILKEQLNNNFSSLLNVNYIDFDTSPNQSCYIENSTYTCYLNSNPFNINDYIVLTTYDNYEYDEKSLIIYSYLFTIVQQTTADFEEGIYSDYAATNKIDDLTYFKENTDSSISSENTKILVNKYKNEITKYKTTFIKENNNFVWKSTEII